MYSGITSGRVLNGQLLYIQLLYRQLLYRQQEKQKISRNMQNLRRKQAQNHNRSKQKKL